MRTAGSSEIDEAALDSGAQAVGTRGGQGTVVEIDDRGGARSSGKREESWRHFGCFEE